MREQLPERVEQLKMKFDQYAVCLKKIQISGRAAAVIDNMHVMLYVHERI